MKKIIGIIIILACACTKNQKSTTTKILKKDTFSISYATTFLLKKKDDKIFLVNTQPWPNAQTTKTFEVRKPIQKIVCTSTSHLPYFELLGMAHTVVGFPNTNYISSKVFTERHEKGFLKEVGINGQINLELLVDLQPDAVIAFDAGKEAVVLEKIKKLGIPIIYNSDFLEQTPLGKAEYIKFFGAILGKQHQADSIFDAIVQNYHRSKKMIEDVHQKPTVFSGVMYGDVWFVPGGNNWMAHFFEDAGANYLWKNSDESGALKLSFESVYETAHQVDFWVGTSTFASKKEMLDQDHRYKYFKAFNNHQVFNFNKKIGAQGGYDFFESAYARPDIVLSDLIKVFHPTILPNYETVYYQKID